MKRINFMAEVKRLEREGTSLYAQGLYDSMAFYMVFGKRRRRLARGGRYAQKELQKLEAMCKS